MAGERRRTYELPPFLGAPGPVELVARLEGASVEGASALLTCATLRYEPELEEHWGTVAETVLREPAAGEAATVRIDACTDEIVRIRFARGAVPEVATPMVVGSFDGVDLAATESETSLTLSTGALRIVVDRDPWRLRIEGPDDAPFFATRPVDLDSFRRAGEELWSEARWAQLHRYAYPLGWTEGRLFASWDLRHDEHVYGLGESFGPFDRRGTAARLWLQEALGNASPASYKQVPFYVSTRGYGLFANTSNAALLHVGDVDHTAVSLVVDDAALLDLYVVHGPTVAEILPRYTAITGAPALPPKWSFGLWLSLMGRGSQERVEETAEEVRARRVPCDVLHVDTDWFEHDWECDWQFGSRFPDPAGMTARLRQRGLRLSLWQWPNVFVHAPLFREALERGYLARRRPGGAHVFSGPFNHGGLLDYSNPATVAWIREKLHALFRLGVAAIKVDFGEGSPPDAVYEGVPSESMHNLYPLLYGKAVFEATEDFFGPGEAVIWARSAWAGSQRYPVHWSGDGVARFEDLACVLRAMLGFGLSGFPFYSHDIGGFTGVPSPELYVRWLQLGVFTSHARLHGTPPREPWAYGEEAERIARRYLELRYRLLPYIWSEAVEAVRASAPLARPLVLDFQDDPTTYAIADEYLFGRSLLVAPVLDESGRRRLYLPHGQWVDYWTGALEEGGRWLDREAPLDTVPLYVRGGAVVPHGPLLQHVDARPLDPLTLRIYAPAEQGRVTVHDRVPIDVAYRRDGDRLLVSVAGAPGAVEVETVGGDPVTAVLERG